MRITLAALVGLMALGACGEDVEPEAFDGVYEVTERVEGSCDEVLEPSIPSPGERFFALEWEPRQYRVSYFTCSSADSCSTSADVPRSFGPVDGGFNGVYSTASSGCVLRHRVRELVETDEGVQIVQTTYQETDETLEGDACHALEARRRGRSMPCVSVVETLARRLPM